MITVTTDPITQYKITDFNNAPYVVEGEGAHALKIYFETEASKLAYLTSPLYTPNDCLFGTGAKRGDNATSRALN